ncbi:dihydrofolate reductase [Undibacterium sp. Ji22W]|uniref:dihydrofolate reductase n=1 Tax=Undibacterium sp. Ji22W TaxID=3413038 RepID=UPI003BF0B271
MTNLSIIVATDKKNGIGIKNQLPWHLPEDLAHFKRTTSGHTIIMGRKTFDSIGRALPNRHNIVISRNAEWQHDNVSCHTSIEAALSSIKDLETFVIGGAQIYDQAMHLAQKLIVTEIQDEFECDAFFPAIDKNIWQESRRESLISATNQLHYAIVTYTRK